MRGKILEYYPIFVNCYKTNKNQLEIDEEPTQEQDV